jgi:hypothetical protein
MNKRQAYDAIRNLTQKDRDEILEFALKRSDEILRGEDEDVPTVPARECLPEHTNPDGTCG